MTEETRDQRALMADALLKLQEARRRIEAFEAEKHGEVAIVGCGLRFPGGPDAGDAVDAEGFWRLLEDGADLVRPTPEDRWDVERFHDDDHDAPGRLVAREGAFLSDPALFDPQHFGISPREAETMDPQQRLLLETTWRALEDAGVSPDALRGTRTGVFVGIATADYSLELVRRLPYERLVAMTGTGTNHSVAAGRIAYTFGLTGPCLAVNTACSSSLVALQLAVMSLRRAECEVALVAGVNAMLSPMTGMVFSNARMLSRDGRCKTFDASADGYGRAEGCGVLVLKRLRDATRDRDRVRACVLGVAANQDGASGGITVPNGPSQQAVIRAALENARVQPGDVSYVEAHGTGTALGDPIELGALGAVFGERATPLAVASIKTNLGHAEAAAGVAGVIKTLLQLEHGRLAPHLHLEEPSHHVPWDRLPVRIPTQAEPWTSSGRRIAGVSSFGFSGTNVHVVLGEAPTASESDEARASAAPASEFVLPLSARSPEALRTLAERWHAYLTANKELGHAALADACFTAGRGRTHFPHRLAIVGSNARFLAIALDAWLHTGEGPGVFKGEVHERLTAKSLTLPAGAGSVALAYVEGLRVPWDALDPDGERSRATIPGYPFDRARFWCLDDVDVAAPVDAAAMPTSDSFVFTEWTWTPKPAPSPVKPEGAWCVVGSGDLVERVRADLIARGAACPADADPATSDAVVFLRDAADAPDEAERDALALLDLIRRLVARAHPPRLFVATRDGVADAALLGLARAAAIEHPELGLRRIVVSGGSGGGLADELGCEDGEDEVQLSVGGREVARIVESAPLRGARLELSGTWLVTGGGGALGRLIAARLAERGAARIILVGRSLTPDTKLDGLDGLPIEPLACDVADEAACIALANSLPSLEGVVHAAGVLDDGVIDEMTPAQLAAVLRPKHRGAWNLHEALATREELQHFVLISSSAALLGSPGQANYVAANWTLEALARARQRAGLPALCVHYGPWAELGMAADEATTRRLAALGMRSLSTDRALAVLETLMATEEERPAAVGYFQVDWRAFARAVPPGVEPRRLDAFLAALPTQAAEGEPELLGELLVADPEDRPALLEDYLARALGRVLRLSPEAVDRRRPFPELGLDSLLGIELRNRVQADLMVTPSMASILGAETLSLFAREVTALLEEAGLIGGDAAEVDEELLGEIESMTDAEVERLLEEE